MKTNQDPPRGYGYGIVEHKTKNHLVKFDVFNSTAVCGAQVFMDSIIDESYGIEREVCDKCVKLIKALNVAR